MQMRFKCFKWSGWILVMNDTVLGEPEGGVLFIIWYLQLNWRDNSWLIFSGSWKTTHANKKTSITGKIIMNSCIRTRVISKTLWTFKGMSKEKDCNVSLFETLPVYFLRFLDKSTLRRKTACSKESRGETPDIQDGGGTRHFKNPEEKGNVLRCRRSKKSDHEKSLLFLLEYFLSSSLSSLYRSGLCRQKTFAWLSPEAVTATDASLKEDDVKKENQHSSVTEETFKTARERERERWLYQSGTCWWWSRGSLRCGRGTRTPCCQCERPTGAALRLSSRWTPQKKTLPTAGERCRPGGTQRGNLSVNSWHF